MTTTAQVAPKRIQRRRAKGWRMPENTVYVGRKTIFGNPFPVEKSKIMPSLDGSPGWQNVFLVNWRHYATREEAVGVSLKLFRAWAEHPAQAIWRRKVVLGLAGKDLACWCPLDQPCHADVLLELANAPAGPTVPQEGA